MDENYWLGGYDVDKRNNEVNRQPNKRAYFHVVNPNVSVEMWD